MFGATSGRLSDVKLFRELGVVAKSFSLKANGMGAEDFKLSALTVASWAQEPDDYYQSELYEYLSQHQFLVAFFQKAKAGSNDDKVFKGFSCQMTSSRKPVKSCGPIRAQRYLPERSATSPSTTATAVYAS